MARVADSCPGWGDAAAGGARGVHRCSGLVAGEVVAAAMVRVAKAQVLAVSGLSCAASASGAARNTAQCASSTATVSSTSRQVGAFWLGVNPSGTWHGRRRKGGKNGLNAGEHRPLERWIRAVHASLIQSDNSPMKLATYKDGSRDGQLVVVSRDLSLAVYASNIANRMQQVLDDWNYLAPQLQDLYDTLNNGRARHAFPFDPAMCLAPLPRAYQWADGSAYLNHVELVRKARGAEVPESFYTDPLMYQGGSDDLQGACSPSSAPAKPLASTLRPKWPSSRAISPWAAPPTARWTAFAWSCWPTT